MKKVLSIIILLLFLLLLWLAWGWYRDTVVCCPEEPEVVQYGPLVFDCETGAVVTNELWPDKKAEIISARTDEKNLLLSGPYFEGESEEAGIARAEKVKALFTEMPAAQIHTAAHPSTDCEGTKMNMLHELKYKWVINNEDVIERLDKTVVFYKYDSDEEITNPRILAYFDELSGFLKSSGDRIMITGHTDSDGTNEYNINLAMKRAEEYKNHLISLGVSADKIDIQSKGESMPMRPNDTEENKRMNRRVEVHIIE
ncbi:OmpA family protein [Robiginitalea sp. SC105]|uniref:OmpA family protein n=1 Tax=Robiginitalea sp. SC105 TaxID=2762332 RepID=UPI00163A52AC|nr:OmpA family protein [Robiginitalea sp. SC105]MBC2839308.1 OmpA family protein [Robiginitalea sp. SC105]